MKSLSTFTLARQCGPIAYFAVVDLALAGSRIDGEPRLLVRHADLPDPVNKVDWKAATAHGIREAVRRLDPGVLGDGVIVTVTGVRGHEVDTTYQTLAYAACFALWDAFGHAEPRPPELSHDSRTLKFPKP